MKLLRDKVFPHHYAAAPKKFSIAFIKSINALKCLYIFLWMTKGGAVEIEEFLQGSSTNGTVTGSSWIFKGSKGQNNTRIDEDGQE